MQNVPLTDVIAPVEVDEALVDEFEEELTPERRATIWVSRITFVVGAICLLLAMGAWLFRPGHYRLVLAFLIVALFASILHSYTFENGGQV